MSVFWLIVGVVALLFIASLTNPKGDKGAEKKFWRHAGRSRWKWKNEKRAEQTEETPSEEGIGDYEIAEFRAHTSAKSYLMTYTENRFFQGLLAQSQERGFLVFTKVRLVDLIDIDPKYYRQQKIFYKLVSKHADFVIADTKGRVVRCIELDDYRHEKENRNDKIKDEVMNACGIELVRVKVGQEYDYDMILGETNPKAPRPQNLLPLELKTPENTIKPMPVIDRAVRQEPQDMKDYLKQKSAELRPSWQK